ncbi:hypothetical protein ACROYT_G010568 [Oculina patagonica]
MFGVVQRSSNAASSIRLFSNYDPGFIYTKYTVNFVFWSLKNQRECSVSDLSIMSKDGVIYEFFDSREYKEIPTTGPNQSANMLSFTRDPITQGHQTKSVTYWGAQQVSVPQPLDMMRMPEPHHGQSESGSEGYCSLENGAAQSEESGIQNLQELQGYLVKYQNSKQDMSSRHVSFSSDQMTPLFDDSGIHLEFTEPSVTDISETDGDTDREQVADQRKFHRIVAEPRGQPSSVTTEKGEESEAEDLLVSDRLDGFETQGHEDESNILNEDLTMKDALRFDQEKRGGGGGRRERKKEDNAPGKESGKNEDERKKNRLTRKRAWALRV